MRVLCYLDSLDRGGSERQAVDVCKNAADYGIEMVAVARRGDLLDELRASGVEVVEVERRIPIDPSLISLLRRIILEKKVQIVHGYQAVEGVHLYLATRRTPVKRVLSFQGFIADRRNRLTLRFLIPRMHANLYVSQGLREWLAETDKLDTDFHARVLYNGADPGRLLPSGRTVKKELDIWPEATVVGMIANFYRDPRKDQISLARALPSVFASSPGAVCLFVGKTENGAEGKLERCRSICTEAGISERVFFLGGRNDVPDILADVDVFVFSSIQEGLPVALTEAMLVGVPCLVSDIEPHLEATDRGRVAAVFRTGDSEDLAEKLTHLLANASRRHELAAKGSEFAKANFSIGTHMRDLKRIYESVMGRAI